MAKGKHATALFEVIHAAKKSTDPSGALRPPKWWFKGRDKAAATGVMPAAPAAPVAPAAAPAEPAPTPAPAPVVAPRAEPPRAVDTDYGDERDGWLINLRFTQGRVVLGAFALVVLIGIAFVAGRHLGRGPAPASAVSLDQLMSGPPNPDVLKTGSAAPNETNAAAPGTTSAQRPRNASPPAPPPAAPQAVDPTIAAELEGKRIVGRHYIIVQSYPDRKDADDAAELLKKNGVACTVEQIDFAPRWWTVITSRGFDKIRSPEFEHATQNIRDISNQLTGSGNLKFKRFEPLAYKWKGP